MKLNEFLDANGIVITEKIDYRYDQSTESVIETPIPGEMVIRANMLSGERRLLNTDYERKVEHALYFKGLSGLFVVRIKGKTKFAAFTFHLNPIHNYITIERCYSLEQYTQIKENLQKIETFSGLKMIDIKEPDFDMEFALTMLSKTGE